MEHCLVLTTVGDRQTAERLAGMLVKEKAAACVSVLPGALSFYEWRGEVTRDEEWLLLIKTRAAAYPRLETLLREAHPYELPEIIAVPIEQGLREYLAWVDQEVQ